MEYSKVIDLQDFDDSQLRPILEDFARVEMRRFGIDQPTVVPDSKHWECAMAARSFRDHGMLRPGALFAGIGAGTEITSFYLASKGAITFPCDRYLERTPWSDVAPPGMMVEPREFSELDYPRGNVVPVHTDARLPRLPSDFFDGAYSAGSIEHFGSLDAVAAAAAETGRILKPGGLASIATEFRLEGPEDRPWFDDNCILFTPELLNKHIIEASGLELVGELATHQSGPTFETRRVLLDFLEAARNVRTLSDKQAAYPNLVLYHEGFLFCSVHLLLRKPQHGWRPAPWAAGKSGGFEDEVAANNATALQSLATLGMRPSQAAGGELRSDWRSERYDALQLRLLQARVALRSLQGSLIGRLAARGASHAAASVRSVQTFPALADSLQCGIGMRTADSIATTGHAGVLVYGPYISLDAGPYTLVARGRIDSQAPGACRLEVTADAGSREVARLGGEGFANTDGDIAWLDFSLAEPARQVEFRLIVDATASGAFESYELLHLGA